MDEPLHNHLKTEWLGWLRHWLDADATTCALHT